MKVFTKIVDLQAALSCDRKQEAKIGFVPTMGALHAGHASLVERSVKDSDVTVVSIFLNPTQFNDKSDLEHYPQTFEADCEMLENVGADYVFAPSVSEIYPTPDTRVFDFPSVTTVMEGAKRPGHFNGVCQIVSKLFDMVTPDKAYFGEKDFQQIAVVRAMMKDLGYTFQLVPCPIVREESGLALSSRNALMSDEERVLATNIYRTLRESVDYAQSHTVAETQQFVVEQLNALEGLEVEYYEIVNGETLQPVTSWEDAPHIQGCITVFCGARPVRLIDNIAYR